MKTFLLSCALTLGVHCLSAQSKLTLDHITDGTFTQKTVSAVNWMNDGQFYSALTANKVVKYDVTTGEEVEVLVDGNELEITISDYKFSADENKILLLTDRQKVYRRSYTAVYNVYEIESKKLNELSVGRLAYATFSPDGSKVAFTRENNLFYMDLNNNQEYAITEDGKVNSIINGSTDWVYEEELYLTKAFQWSPDGEKIAYYRFDESGVRQYNMQKWNEGALYPEDYIYKYPKAGEDNSIVEIYIYDLNDELTKADIGEDTDIYIPRIYWTKDTNLLSIQRLNRLQNKLDILHVNASTGESEVILTDQSETYIDFTFCDDLTYLENGKQFLFSSEKSGFKHFYLHNMDGSLLNQVTSGDYEAVDMVGLDQSSRAPILYYTSSELSPLERSLYKIDLRGKGKKRLTSGEGNVSIEMSDDSKYYMNYQSNSSTPLKVELFRTKENTKVKDLEDNEELKVNAEKYDLVSREFFTFSLEDGTALNGYFLKPKDFDETKKYPLLMYQYSGPGSQQVSNSWGTGTREVWHQYLVQNGYLIAVVDGRGTGYRGEEFKKMTYGNMGYYEVEDQISAGKYLASLPYVDETRIGVWGWSYGGYMSSLCLFKGTDVFKTGIAVAPFTWRYYDTIYSERYLGLPQDNPKGYDDNNPMNHVERLKGNYFLIHGTGDDNVHFQIAVGIQDALINAGKQFRSFYYPDKAHGLRGRHDHLYRMMTDFILEKL